MQLTERIESFVKLGNQIRLMSEAEKEVLFQKANIENPWFTPQNLERAWQGLVVLLEEDKLQKWLSAYSFEETASRTIGVVMAGNIPAVGFHDALCVLLRGNSLVAKLSSQDEVLMKFLLHRLTEIEPRFADRIVFAERLNDTGAFIGTGSDNAARYFEYYFSRKPHLIRKNRTGVAVLTGEETKADLQALGKDIFWYFGLGCRNVSKLYVPENYVFDPFFEAIEIFAEEMLIHNKYMNNHDYHHAILLMNQSVHLHNGFLSVVASEKLVSPTSVLFYSTYRDIADVQVQLIENQEKIQCVVTKDGWLSGSFPFGQAQLPEVSDYADGVDTMQFLTQIL
jgi:hypothetical protein